MTLPPVPEVVHHVNSNVYAPSDCGLPMSVKHRTVAQDWKEVTCPDCLKHKPLTACEKGACACHKPYAKPWLPCSACKGAGRVAGLYEYDVIECSECCGSGVVENKEKPMSKPKWWVQTDKCSDGKTRIATGDGEQPSMIVWLSTYSGDEPQEQTARMVCDAVNAWQSRPVQEPVEEKLVRDKPWVIKPPEEKEISCFNCGAVIGYTESMVRVLASAYVLDCPCCNGHIALEKK